MVHNTEFHRVDRRHLHEVISDRTFYLAFFVRWAGMLPFTKEGESAIFTANADYEEVPFHSFELLTQNFNELSAQVDIVDESTREKAHWINPVAYNNPRAHETGRKLEGRLLLEKKKD